MEGFTIRPLTLQSIRGHDVLLDIVHDLLDSSIEPSYQHNRKLMGHTLISLKLK